MQYSTAFSDALLAAACLGAAFVVGRARQRLGGHCLPLLIGFLLPASAALCGVVRFGFSEAIAPLHSTLSQASGLLGLPLLGLAAFAISRALPLNWRHWLGVLALLGAGALLAGHFAAQDGYRLLLNLLPLLLLIDAAARQRPKAASLAAAIGAVALILLAGVVIGTQGFVGSLPRVDLFHGLLALAYGLLGWLLTSLQAHLPAQKRVKTL